MAMKYRYFLDFKNFHLQKLFGYENRLFVYENRLEKKSNINSVTSNMKKSRKQEKI